MMNDFVFIGGLKRGYALLNALLQNQLVPKMAFVTIEDEHESEKYSPKIAGLLEGKSELFFRKKLTADYHDLLSQQQFDFGIVCGWRSLLSESILSDTVFRKGIFAAHDSLLPKYRGCAPSNWAIINGERETGVSIFKIGHGKVDSGDIYFQ